MPEFRHEKPSAQRRFTRLLHESTSRRWVPTTFQSCQTFAGGRSLTLGKAVIWRMSV